MEETNEVVELTYVPRYVKQVADYLHGDTVSHEAYNQMLNVNSIQGDYNTEVLDTLFNKEDTAYKIKYVDKQFTELNETIEGITTDVGDIKETLDAIGDSLDMIDNIFAEIEDGVRVVGHARVADEINGLSASGPNRYFGTDANTNVGFYPVPDNIYYEDIGSAVGIDVINIVPADGTVTEAMLDADVQTKLNRQQGVTDYEYLNNLPQINGVTLIGDLSIADLGIQEAGDFVTNTALNTTLEDYVTNTSLGTTLNDYVTNSSLATTLDGYSTNANANSKAVIQIGSFSGTPKAGDMYVTF